MERKRLWWDHFVGSKKYHAHGFTIRRLEKARDFLWNDDDFWWDVLDRHRGREINPEDMEKSDPEMYHHLMGNMMGMIMQTMVEEKIIKV